MYYDIKQDRVLLRDGRSIVSAFSFAKRTVEGLSVDGLYIENNQDSRIYDQLYLENRSSELEEVEVTASLHEHNEEDLDMLMSMIVNSDRYKDIDEYNERIYIELDYFDRSKNITFVIKCKEMIDKFKEDGVVYGVGRGSSCASLLLYLLEITDIDPIRFDIPFHELSKEVL